MIKDIFNIDSENKFNSLCLEIFNYQYKNNIVYKDYVNLLKINISSIDNYSKIPFLPIELFKYKKIIAGDENFKKVFFSSGTTSKNLSKHYIKDIELFEQSFIKGFELFYNSPKNYIILSLLPSYLENDSSSLVYMADKLMKLSNNSISSFFINNFKDLNKIINDNQNKTILLLGVSYALLDFAEQYQPDMSKHIVMETGGMKGRKKEISKEELHSKLQTYLNTENIHSEYGMTELSSQAYAKTINNYSCPSWMKILIRQVNDPFAYNKQGITGGINIIDLANINSCSFIETQDLGRIKSNGNFEIIGRFDNSDQRGCSLLYQDL